MELQWIQPKILVDPVSQFCAKCGNDKTDLIQVDENCLASHLGDFICKDCCRVCDWHSSCAIIASQEQSFQSKTHIDGFKF
jgi:hypothetical protein